MKPVKLYHYVGPDEIRTRVTTAKTSQPIQSLDDLQSQLETLGFRHQNGFSLTVTFVISADGQLRIADRHSEHVVCAGTGDVQSAGEMTFAWDRNRCIVESVTNQSTGYCPEPISWNAVANVLEKLGINHPLLFEIEFRFRRCPNCRQTNIVKDDWFVCEVCGSTLPAQWNYNPPGFC